MPVDLRTALATSVRYVTREWTAQQRQADREGRISAAAMERLRQATKPCTVTIRDAAFAIMEAAYLKASSNGRLPANARQIMYAARPYILAHASKPWGPSTDQYVTQTVIPDFLEAHPELTANWDVVFDDRGHLIEPHTSHRIGLGTIAVRRYVAQWGAPVSAELPLDGAIARLAQVGTRGPRHRYGAVLFVEKEGFDALWEAVDLANRFDLAIMSTKGVSVTAARHLVEQLSEADIPIYVLHDLDKAGFTILHTLRTTTRRYRFARAPRVIDLGLRLDDVQAMGLPSEQVEYRRDKADPRVYLATAGATEAERALLVQGQRQGVWYGERVELNAMDSDQLVAWLEGKLTAAGVRKVMPDTDTLAIAWRRACQAERIRQAIQTALDADQDTLPPPPDDLAERVADQLDGTATAWDTAIWQLASAVAEDDE